MKFVLALCLVLSVASANWTVPSVDEMKRFREECAESENVSEANQKKVFAGLYPDELSVRCYLRCVTTKYGFWEDTNGLIWERAVKFLAARKQTVSKEAVDKCNSKNGEDLDACTWGYKVYTCLLDNNYFTPITTN